jgi:signal transduction histidine kinase
VSARAALRTGVTRARDSARHARRGLQVCGEARRCRITVTPRTHTDRAKRDPLGGLHPRGAGPLRSADRMAGLGTLVAGVAHELANPITYVLGNLDQLGRLAGSFGEVLASHRAELLRLLGPQAEPALKRVDEELERSGGLALMEELVAESLEGAARIRDTVRELLSYARPQATERGPLELGPVLDFNLRMLKVELRSCARLERDYRATQHVLGSRAGLGQVLLNLLRNAIQACAPGDPSRHCIAVRTRDCPGGVEVEITDSGCGIPPEVRPHLFKPFFSTRAPEQGTGLGLYISRWIVEEHGGTLEFVCPPGGGSRFRVCLPALTANRAEAGPQGRAEAGLPDGADAGPEDTADLGPEDAVNAGPAGSGAA